MRSQEKNSRITEAFVKTASIHTPIGRGISSPLPFFRAAFDQATVCKAPTALPSWIFTVTWLDITGMLCLIPVFQVKELRIRRGKYTGWHQDWTWGTEMSCKICTFKQKNEKKQGHTDYSSLFFHVNVPLNCHRGPLSAYFIGNYREPN